MEPAPATLQFTPVCIDPVTTADMAAVTPNFAVPVLTPSPSVSVKVIELGTALSTNVVPAPPREKDFGPANSVPGFVFLTETKHQAR